MIRINGVDYPSTANDSSVPGKPYGTYEMINNPNIYEPQRTNNFEFMVTGLGNKILKSGFNEGDEASYWATFSSPYMDSETFAWRIGARYYDYDDRYYYRQGRKQFEYDEKVFSVFAGIGRKFSNEDWSWYLTLKHQDTEYDDGEGYYVKYTYWLKSSGDAITLSPTGAAKTLNIQELSVTGNSGSEDLDKALRVAIVVNGKAYIYAPLYADNALPTYYVAASDDETTPLAKGTSQPTAMETLPAVTEDGTPVYVYLYFEGEDVNLKTDNVTETLDNLTVTFKFALVDHATTVTDNGVNVS